MIIDFNKFWEFIKQWSVGRLIVLLTLIGWITLSINDSKCLDNKFIFSLLFSGILLEIFELTSNNLIKSNDNIEKICRLY